MIIGTGHLFNSEGPGPLKAKIDAAYPNKLAVVSPFVGYVEPECNARIAAQTKDWPVPSVVGPVEGTRLKLELELEKCNYSVKDQHDMWANSDAILYLGAPDSLTVSAMDPNIYLDLDYFNEENRRLRCCTPNEPLDWDKLFQGGTPSQGKIQRCSLKRELVTQLRVSPPRGIPMAKVVARRMITDLGNRVRVDSTA